MALAAHKAETNGFGFVAVLDGDGLVARRQPRGLGHCREEEPGAVAPGPFSDNGKPEVAGRALPGPALVHGLGGATDTAISNCFPGATSSIISTSTRYHALRGATYVTVPCGYK